MNLYIHVQHTVSIVFFSEETLSERQFFRELKFWEKCITGCIGLSMVILKTVMVYTILPHLVDQIT